MAIAIKNVPILSGKNARRFLKQIDKSENQTKSLTEEAEYARRILEKSRAVRSK